MPRQKRPPARSETPPATSGRRMFSLRRSPPGSNVVCKIQKMKSTQTITAQELEKRLKGVRSLSGCYRIVRIFDHQDLDALQSSDKIALLTQLLEKMKGLSGLDPETMSPETARENRELVRHYTVILMERIGQRNISGNGLAEGVAEGKKALRCATALKDEVLEGLALNHLGNAQMLTRNLHEAQESFLASARLDRRTGNPEALARSLYNLSRAQLALGLFDEALNAVEEGLGLYEHHAALPAYGQAFFLGIRQDIHESRNEQGKALADGLRSLELLKREKIDDRLVPAHYHLVHRYIWLDQPTDAMHHAMQAASVAARTNTPVDRILASFALGTVYIRLEEYDTAMTYARQGLELARRLGLKKMEVLGLERIARILGHRKEHRLALPYLYEAVEKEERPKGKGDLYRIIASAWLELDETGEARRAIRQKLETHRHLKDSRLDGEFLLVSAAISVREGKPDEAIEGLNTIVEAESARLTFRRDAHLALSEIYEKNGNPAKALEHYRLFHSLAIELEQRLAAERLVVFRARHEVESHRTEATRAREIQQHVEQEKEGLALEISERQRAIEQTKQKIGSALRSLEQENIAEGKKILHQAIRGLNKAPAPQEQWLRHLPNIDDEFFARLRERYPNLTKGQIRLCGLLRSGLSSSDIAQRLHISIETVITQRKRLRKRMNLKEGEDLEMILARM